MQTENRYNIPKRSRHYQSVIDIKLMPAGEMDYNKLNPVIIIFICTFDLFGRGRKVFLNTKGNNDSEVSEELIEFLRMVEDPDMRPGKSARVQKIYNRVETVKKDVQVEARYMRELTYENESNEN